MIRKLSFILTVAAVMFLCDPIENVRAVSSTDQDAATVTVQEFVEPPILARPGAFWPWLSGNVSLDQITYELKEMKDKGMSGADIWDVLCMSDPQGFVPAGPAFLGPESVNAICHAIKEATRLDLQLGMIAASGWNAGGPWVEPKDAGMGLYCSQTEVTGPSSFSQVLPFPEVSGNCPKGADGLPIYYKDIAVQAVPCTNDKTMDGISSVIDLSGYMQKNGQLIWEVPAGKWTIIRYISTNTGHQLIVPSPNSGGPMIDFLNASSTEMHFQYIIDKLLDKLGSFEGTAFKHLEVDSMELGSETAWTGQIVEQFKKDYGYDPMPYLPVLKGWKTKNPDIANRFLCDWKKNISDMFIENHYRKGSELLNKYGLKLCAEAGGPGPPVWDSCPVESLKALGAVDIPRGEFWVKHRSIWLIKEISSAAHIYGKTIVDAESFTSWRHWKDGPYFYKQLADRAFCEGLNRLSFHVFSHSPAEAGMPGRVYHAGTHINVNLAWWPKAKPFIYYLARCCYLLQQGLFVGDVCYYYGDKAPNFVPPKHIDPSLGYGYDYDVCNSDVILNRMTVKNGRIVLPDGMSYELLVLPDQDDMNLQVLEKLAKMVRSGATIVGPKPTRTNTLVDYPHGDKKVQNLADRLWGNCNGRDVKEQSYGKGKVVWNRPLRQILQQRGIGPDFSFQGRDKTTALDYIHRRTKNEDIYFIVNQNERWEDADCIFRVIGKQPHLWIPQTGEVRKLWVYNSDSAQGTTRIPLRLPPAGTAFVLFREKADDRHFTSIDKHYAANNTVYDLQFSHSITPNGPMWLSDGISPIDEQYIIFDLADSYDLDKIEIWNYNENVRGLLDRGGQTIKILTSPDNITYKNLGVFTLKMATENEDKHFSQEIALAEPNVRYVKLDIDTNHGDRQYVGLSKIKFFGPDEISAVTVEDVSSGLAADPKDDNSTGDPLPAIEILPKTNTEPYLRIWKPGIYVLNNNLGESKTINISDIPQAQEITGSWQVRFPEGWGAPPSKTFTNLISWTEDAEDGVKYFSGTATYHKEFELDETAVGSDKHLVLDLGAVYDIADVYLNDKHLGILWKPPFRIDITGAVKAGKNKLAVEITNTWQNRLVGDAQLPKDQRYCRTNMIYSRLFYSDTEKKWKDQILQESGLIGPVRIHTAIGVQQF